MQKSNEDCFYYLTSNCAKGPSCTYRHSPQVLSCNVICPTWMRGNCLDPACPLRHSTTLQRPPPPPVNNGVLCFFENTPTGCLKLDCTFFHSRPRPNLRNASGIRPSTTNLINKDAGKTATPPPSPTTAVLQTPPVPAATPVANVQIAPSQQKPLPPSPPKVETPAPADSSSSVKEAAVPRRVAQPNDETSTSQPKSTIARCVIAEESSPNQSRVAVHRNVVIAEPANVLPTRKIVQVPTSSSNRVVVSSIMHSHSNGKSKITTHDSDSDVDLDDLMEQENDNNKFKQDSQSTNSSMIDIPFPCSAPSITNRLLFMKPTTTTLPTSDTKPIRLNRNRLPPAAKPFSGNSSSSSVPTTSSEEQTSTGNTETKLSQDNERRSNRLERFKQMPISPPRSIVCSSTTTTNTVSRNVVASSPNERKRTANESTIVDSPPSKRVSSTSSLNQERDHNQTTIGDLCSPSDPRRTQNRHYRHRSSSQRNSPPHQKVNPPITSFTSSTTAVNESTWKKTVDEFIAKTNQPRGPMTVQPPQPVPLLSLRPRFAPTPTPAAPRPIRSQFFRPRQPPSFVPKRPPAPVIPPSKPAEPTTLVEKKVPEPIVQAPLPSSINVRSVEDDEDELLELNAPTDVIDAFALIDEALLETDNFLELM